MLNKVANVLERLADYLEHSELEKTAEEQTAKENAIIKIAQTFATKTGLEPSDNFLKQLLGTNIQELTKMAELLENKQDFSLGQPSNKPDYTSPALTTKEAATNAEQAFLDWILS